MRIVQTPAERLRRKRARNAKWMKQWRAKNPLLSVERDRAWREANPARERAINVKAGAKYRNSDPVHYRQLKKNESIRNASSRRKYRIAHRVETRARCKEWTLKNPERASVLRRNSKHKRRVQINATSEGKACAQKIRELLKEAECHWCQCELTLQTITIDHVYPLSRGGAHVPSNLVAACGTCNTRKSNRLPEEWLKEVA